MRFYSYKLLEDENTSSAIFSVDATGQAFTEVVLDYEAQSSHIIRVRTRDQFGAEYVEEIGIEVLDATVPIVHTRLPVLEWQVATGGQIEHRGGLERATHGNTGEWIPFTRHHGNGPSAEFIIMQQVPLFTRFNNLDEITIVIPAHFI